MSSIAQNEDDCVFYSVWGMPINEVFQIAINFFKDKTGTKALNLTYHQKLNLIALIKQSVHGSYNESKSSQSGLFDIVGNDRKNAWNSLGEMPKNIAMQKFIESLKQLCPLFEAHVIAHRVDKEEDIRKREEDVLLLNEQLKQQQLIDQQAFQEQQEKQILQELMIRNALNQQTFNQFKSYSQTQFPNNPEQQDQLVRQLQEQHYQQYMLQIFQRQQQQQQLNNAGELQTTTQVAHNTTNPSFPHQTQQTPKRDVQQNGYHTNDTLQYAQSSNTQPPDSQPSSWQTTNAQSAYAQQALSGIKMINALEQPSSLQATNTQSAYAQQALSGIKTINALEQPSSLQATNAQSSGHTRLNADGVGTNGQLSATGVREVAGSYDQVGYASNGLVATDSVRLESAGNAGSVGTASVDAGRLKMAGHETATSVDPGRQRMLESACNHTCGSHVGAVVGHSHSEHCELESATSNDASANKMGGDGKAGPAASCTTPAGNLIRVTASSAVNNNAVANGNGGGGGGEHSRKVAFTPAIQEAPVWTRKDIKEFKESLKNDTEAIIKVGWGEMITVRVPTHEKGNCLYWEFATDATDIGFGLSFEHLDDSDATNTSDAAAKISVVLPVQRRKSHEEVFCGSHLYPCAGTYQLLFDNTYSFWRSKTVYYRVYYS